MSAVEPFACPICGIVNFPVITQAPGEPPELDWDGCDCLEQADRERIERGEELCDEIPF